MRTLFFLLLSASACFAQSEANAPLLLLSPSLRAGLRGYWRMDESSGIRYDCSGHGNNLGPRNAPGSTAGKVTNCATFVAASQQSLGITNHTLGSGNESFTVGMWVYPTTTNASKTFCYNATNGQDRFLLYTDTGDTPKLRVFSSGTSVIVTHSLSAVRFPLNRWSYLVAWYDASRGLVGLSFNGTQAKLASTGGTALNSTPVRFLVGDDLEGTPSSFNVDEMGYWNRALNDREISQLYNSYGGALFPMWRRGAIATNFFRLASLPTPVEEFGLESLNGLVYAVAGINAGWTNTVYAYDPTNNLWSQKASYPLNVESLCLRAVNGKLYGVGGYSNKVCFNKTYEYDPAGDTWTAKSDMPIGLEDMASAVVSNKIYIVGGLSTNSGTTHTISPYIQVYDPVGNTWSTNFATMPNPRCLGDFGATDGTNIFLVGGTADMSQYGGNLLASYRSDKYDVGANSWSQVANVPFQCCYKDMEYINGKIYSFGTTWGSTTNYHPFIQIYDVGANSWSFGPDMPYSARGVGAAQVGSIIVFGGGYDGTWRSDFYSYQP